MLMGWSGGGQVAIQFTAKYPQLVEKLIVWGCWDLFKNEHLPIHRCMMPLAKFSMNSASGQSLLFLIFTTDHRDLRNEKQEFVRKRVAAHALSYEEYERHWHMWTDMVEREHFHQDYDKWVEKFKNITCPTLIIAGTEDTMAPIDQAYHLHKHISNSR